jgi:hypothetical protein
MKRIASSPPLMVIELEGVPSLTDLLGCTTSHHQECPKRVKLVDERQSLADILMSPINWQHPMNVGVDIASLAVSELEQLSLEINRELHSRRDAEDSLFALEPKLRDRYPLAYNRISQGITWERNGLLGLLERFKLTSLTNVNAKKGKRHVDIGNVLNWVHNTVVNNEPLRKGEILSILGDILDLTSAIIAKKILTWLFALAEGLLPASYKFMYESEYPSLGALKNLFASSELWLYVGDLGERLQSLMEGHRSKILYALLATSERIAYEYVELQDGGGEMIAKTGITYLPSNADEVVTRCKDKFLPKIKEATLSDLISTQVEIKDWSAGDETAAQGGPTGLPSL